MVDLFEAVYIEMNMYRSMCAHIFSCRLIGPSLVPYDSINLLTTILLTFFDTL